MHKLTIKRARLFSVLFLILTYSFSFNSLYSQNLPISQIDFSKLQVEQLSDKQIETLIEQAKSRGLSLQDLEAEAISRGMPYSEILKLRQRVEKLIEDRGETIKQGDQSERKVDNDTLLSQKIIEDFLIPDEKIEFFGHDLFKKENLSFAPSLNIPTPQNYILGPGDEIVIEVWGASQQTYRLRISPEGQINIGNLGLVKVGGLTIEGASELLINRLSTIYSGLRRPNPNTYAQVSLGNIRSIKVTIAGDAFMPGTYTLPAFATAFNALYLSGGPSDKGSFRDIRIIRNGIALENLDLYDFLLKGDTKTNLRLQDEDLLFIGPYKERVIAAGEVKRIAAYELLENETLSDLIHYFGGFSAGAYSKRLKIYRMTESQRSIMDVESEIFSSFTMKNGDSLNVEKILDRFENRVTIKGAVLREGEYAIVDDLTLLGLLNRAEGLREDAFLHRAVIYRLANDFQIEAIDFSLQNIISGEEPDLALKREDVVVISSILELQQERVVEVVGEVQFPNIYPYVINLTLGELIRKAGGLTEAASLSRVEVARRVVSRVAVSSDNRVAQLFSFPIDANLSLKDMASSFVLEPFDMVFVRTSPGYKSQSLVKVEGEVNFPGEYAIVQKTERISDLINRAGGFTDEAYIPGATLLRKVEITQTERLERISAIDTTVLKLDIQNLLEAKEQSIGINLQRILRNPGGRDDLMLMKDDILRIPQELQTVRLNGALLYPVTTRYVENFGVRKYVSQAGGFAPNAKKNNVYVIYANGSVDRTRSYGLFKSYPSIEPGAEIIVPKKPEREGRTLQETIAISSAIASLALILVTLLNQF